MHLGVHSKWSKYSFEFSHMPVYSAKLGNYFGIGSPSLTCDSLGNGLGYTLNNRNPKWEESGRHIAESHRNCYVESRLPINLAYLTAITDLCANHDIDLIIYTQPEWHTYRENIDMKQVNRMKEMLTNISRQKRIHYIILKTNVLSMRIFLTQTISHMNMEPSSSPIC